MRGGPRWINKSITGTTFPDNILIFRIISAFVDHRGATRVNGQKYNYESFPDFTNVILNRAEEKKCNISKFCSLDNHVKYVPE